MTDRKKTLLCIGECMVEMAPMQGRGFAMGFAGDTFNTAWYARRMLPTDWQVDYGTGVGDDAVSREMLEFISASGVGTSRIVQVPDRTVGLYMIQLQDGERSFSYWRNQSAARALADDDTALETMLNGADVVFFSGITLAVLEPQARTRFCAAIARARERGQTTVFDTNMRPRLWASPEAMAAGITEGAAVADVVLPSFDEDEAAFGDTDPSSTISRYKNLGATTVVVKNGGGRMSVWTKGQEIFHFDPERVVDVVDTTAAGDSFDAGFLARFLTNGSLQEAVEQGALLAARVVRGKGALVDEAIGTKN